MRSRFSFSHTYATFRKLRTRDFREPGDFSYYGYIHLHWVWRWCIRSKTTMHGKLMFYSESLNSWQSCNRSACILTGRYLWEQALRIFTCTHLVAVWLLIFWGVWPVPESCWAVAILGLTGLPWTVPGGGHRGLRKTNGTRVERFLKVDSPTLSDRPRKLRSQWYRRYLTGLHLTLLLCREPVFSVKCP